MTAMPSRTCWVDGKKGVRAAGWLEEARLAADNPFAGLGEAEPGNGWFGGRFLRAWVRHLRVLEARQSLIHSHDGRHPPHE